MAAVRSEVSPVPFAFMILTGMMRSDQLMPAMPIPSLALAAMIPATHVPWPLSSAGTLSLLTKSWPGTMRPARSGCPNSTPVSSTAIIRADPVERDHASRTRMRSSEYCGPVLGSFTATVVVTSASCVT